MTVSWLEFLKNSGAVVEHDRVISFTSFPNPGDETGRTCLCELTNLGLIHVSGDDTESFLHSQFTNDLHQVTTHLSQLSSYCNPKGRILCIFRIFKRDGDYYLILLKDVLQLALQKLTLYKLRSRVELFDKSDQLVLFGIAGPETESALNHMGIDFPENDDECLTDDGVTVIRVPGVSTRALFVCTPERAISLWKSFSDVLPCMTYRVWDQHDILSGIPQVTANTMETFTPQMTNLELVNGVSFTKGCYPGQEVVARTHYLGKPNRRMYRAAITAGQAPEPGTNIFSLTTGNQAIGKVVVSQMVSKGSAIALVVLRSEMHQSPDLHIQSTTGPDVSIQKLPYSLLVQSV